MDDKIAAMSTRIHPQLRQQGLLSRAGYGEIRNLWWDQQGLWVATQASLLLWDPQQGKLLRRLWTPLRCCARDQTGRFFSASLEIDIWDAHFQHQASLAPHRGRIEALCVSPQGDLLASLGEEGELVVCQFDGTELRRLQTGSESRNLQVDWESKKARVGSEVWDLGSGVSLPPSPPPPRAEPQAGWTVNESGQLCLDGQAWEVTEDPVIHWTASPDGARVAVASERELLVLDREGQVLRSWDEFGEWSLCMALSSDERWIASGSLDGAVYLRVAEGGKAPKRVALHGDAITSLTFAARSLISGCADGTIGIWTFPDLEPLHQLDGHDGAVQHLLLQGTRLFSAGADGQIHCWDTGTGLLLASMTGFEANVEQFQLAHHGELLLALYDDGSWLSWDLTSLMAE